MRAFGLFLRDLAAQTLHSPLEGGRGEEVNDSDANDSDGNDHGDRARTLAGSSARYRLASTATMATHTTTSASSPGAAAEAQARGPPALPDLRALSEWCLCSVPAGRPSFAEIEQALL